ncbi:MAG: hypothetical protein JEZ00_06290 [Anaerolineaceae bacterium]|nr:hypothetical protein [Anaerolineaceae bacterium]
MASSRLLSKLLGSKPKTKTNIRVSGLVKAMSLAREQLTSGIPENGVEEFRHFVTQTLANTDQICRTHLIKPQDLPAPSYRAYQYLKQINLSQIPIVDKASAPVQRIRISNLNAAVRHIQQRVMEVTREIYHGTPGARKHMREVQNTVAQQNAYLQLMLKKKKAEIVDLPPRSASSALWLNYLSDDENYQTVIDQLVTCCEIYEDFRKKSRASKRIPVLKHMSFEFLPMSALYRWRVKDGLGQMSFHPGFICANKEIFEIIISSAILRRNSKNALKIRQFSSSTAFMEIAKMLEGEIRPDDAVGQFHDLNELFEDVNQQYFRNRCERPKIKWGSRITRRKFGMYLPTSDTVVVSLSLDQQYVPRYVVAFILYHELLHKQLGMKDTAKRQIAHTSKFRQMEKQFVKYNEAQRFLEKLARTR